VSIEKWIGPCAAPDAAGYAACERTPGALKPLEGAASLLSYPSLALRATGSERHAYNCGVPRVLRAEVRSGLDQFSNSACAMSIENNICQ
jgi:hypothetical protein